ncbi:hypothetical protein HYPSUDRAFT_602382 [Hypholoma sublateritium FD-334 SS-4]|uniref:Cytochrome P450 n=1 Tax=Hypholoma sublateritium (strain FD-334 SS-4) TaxID=945553 RepID=A0A0D2PTY7_HYPSF|nr:hypothetical protein HYPSUDRAFT_602382 [Hypholoma sublateritium FD-334 SS-4]
MISDIAPFALILSILVCLWALSSANKPHIGKLPYPPGPTPSFIWGNRNDLSAPRVWVRYAKWANEQHLVLADLQQEDNHSQFVGRCSRVTRTTVESVATSLRVYGPEWRKHRRIFQQGFKSDSCLEYRPVQTKKMHDMLYGLLRTPDDFKSHVYTYTGAIVLSVMAGYNVVPNNDPYVKLAESLLEAFRAAPMAKWKINMFPILRYIPSWLPGAGFKRYANLIKGQLAQQREFLFKSATAPSVEVEGERTPVVADLLPGCSSDSDVRMLLEAAGSAYTAGTGTTASSILVFFVAMASFPEIQKKAQEEVDRVTGGQRLPEYDDRAHLPYTEAIIREVLRWRPLFPLGLPHASMEDDVYSGYYIPKGSIIYPNVWAMTRDPVKYKDPEIFNPDRFLTETGELIDDEVTYAFGFGRRICPGRHLSSASIWLSAAAILSAFDVERKKDESGCYIPLDVKYVDKGITSHPLSFQCTILPRSEKAVQLILERHAED